jgi:hypothetical protein
MSLLAFLVTVPLGNIFDKLPKGGDHDPPPKPFAEGVRLPGKVPTAVQDVHGGWQTTYFRDDAIVKDERVELLVNLSIKFKKDGTYQLNYVARWGNQANKGDGVSIDETGTYKLSSDVLLLDPVETYRAEVVKREAQSREPTHNEKHLLVVQREKKRLHIAGKCAKYQVDPLCNDYHVENVWYALKGPKGGG